MVKSVDDACHTIDAAIFTGDSFIDKEAIKELRCYMSRWERQLCLNEETLKDMEGEKENV